MKSSLKVQNSQDQVKRMPTNISSKNKQINSSDSLHNDEIIAVDESQQDVKGGGVINFMLNKVTSKQKDDSSRKQVFLNNRLTRIFDDKIQSSHKIFSDKKKRQKFMIINALLKKFHIAFQKRIEYKILFSYLKNLVVMLLSNLDELKKLNIKERQEPTVQQFRKIYSVFTLIKDEKRKNNIDSTIYSSRSKRAEADKERHDRENKERNDNKIQLDNQVERQHIELYRQRISNLLPVKQTIVNSQTTSNSVDNRNTKSQNIFDKLDNSSKIESIKCRRRLKNYMQEENRFIEKKKKQVLSSFCSLQRMESTITATTAQTKKNPNKVTTKDFHRMIAEEMFGFNK